jgi:hypothetical protein
MHSNYRGLLGNRHVKENDVIVKEDVAQENYLCMLITNVTLTFSKGMFIKYRSNFFFALAQQPLLG